MSTSSASGSYVRIKRKNQTFFISLPAEPAGTAAAVKEEVGGVVGVEPRNIRFFGPDKTREVPDSASVDPEGLLYMVYKSGDGWEDIEVTGSGELK